MWMSPKILRNMFLQKIDYESEYWEYSLLLVRLQYLTHFRLFTEQETLSLFKVEKKSRGNKW